MWDMTDRIETEDKVIEVLDDLLDIESVTKRYKKKGWKVVHTSKPRPLSGDAPTVKLHLQRPKQNA